MCEENKEELELENKQLPVEDILWLKYFVVKRSNFQNSYKKTGEADIDKSWNIDSS